MPISVENQMSVGDVNVRVRVSQELSDAVEAMANYRTCTKSEIVKRSLALMELCLREQGLGNSIAVINCDRVIVKEIVGF
jgi:hypothetical protein